MTEPAHHLGDGFDGLPRRNEWPAHHHHRQRQLARGLDFCRRGIATGVLGHHDLDAVFCQHGIVGGAAKRPAGHDQLRVGKRQRRPRRIDQPDQITVLRMRGENIETLPPDAEKHPARRRAERFGRSLQIIDLDPAIAGRAPPGLALQRQQRQAGQGASSDRVGTHLRGERMRGVDNAGDLFGAKIVDEAIDAAETAEPPGNRRPRRAFGTAGIRQDRVEAGVIRYRLRKPISVGSAAENQDAPSSGQEGCHDEQR